MRRKQFDPTAIFQSPTSVAKITGFSPKYIRDGCKNGKIPCILVGADFRVNLPKYLEILDALSTGDAGTEG